MTQDLLKKYMRHVLQCEGTTFVDHISDSWRNNEVNFTEKEKSILRSAHAEISADPWGSSTTSVVVNVTAPEQAKRIGMADILARANNAAP